ncbi:MAG TPA: NAD-dependent epimerase/dehydratase family protein [Euzebya sp.]|nr:NAD-dependent epimerase/dehydratase family protein [Euzebya sp.]
MDVLLIGGTGVLGVRTVRRLVKAGHDVVAVSRRPQSDDLLRLAGVTPLRLDVFDADAVTRAADGVGALINIATSIPSSPFPSSRWEMNHRLRRDAAAALSTAAIRTGARFLQESFAPTYPDRGSQWITEDTPLDPIDQTATVPAAEAAAQAVTAAGGTGVVLRFGLFYDAASPQTRQMVDMARRGHLMLPGPAARYTTMIHVEDAAAAVVAALQVPPGTYNAVEDEPLTRTAHAEVLATLLARRRVRPLPAVLGRVPYVRVMARSHRMSNAKLTAAADWRPQYPSVREGWPQVLQEQADGR